MKKRAFNFRHVMSRVGIPSCNQNNWDIGQALCKYMAKQGVEPDRLLTEKTNPNPTVAAPHCIAHYPIEYYEQACSFIAERWGDRGRQQSLF